MFSTKFILAKVSKTEQKNLALSKKDVITSGDKSNQQD